MCGIGGGAGAGLGAGLAAAGAGEKAAGDGAGAGVGNAFPPAGAGGTAFFRLFAINTPATMRMMSSTSRSRTTTITMMSHTGKLDFSFPSTFACWLLWISRSTSECCGNIRFTSSNFGIA